MDAKVAPLGWLNLTDVTIRGGAAGLGIDTTLQHFFFCTFSKVAIALLFLDVDLSSIFQVTYKNIPSSLPFHLFLFQGQAGVT